ncbi:MAG: type II toxin-antitoxin system VapC family toxin [Verrucomicrobiota bacterium]|nr:type II toxin-antitoxin system VapC family toxin [Verrucomicrobiota bacterium]
MKLLLDTHVALWIVSEPERLSRKALRAFRSSEELFLSIASLWELAKKIAVGKLQLAPGWARNLPSTLVRDGVQTLPVQPDDCDALVGLPLQKNRDPFDRMLLAQALQRDLALMTIDKNMKGHGVKVVWLKARNHSQQSWRFNALRH